MTVPVVRDAPVRYAAVPGQIAVSSRSGFTARHSQLKAHIELWRIP